jgi:glycosyltransferase involved in cell wall biosynthesis
MRFYRQLASSFERRTRNEIVPDIILCGMPTYEMALAAINHAKPRNIPVVIDVRDLWPDIFVDVVPYGIHWLAKLVLWPLFEATRKVFSEATCITAISSNYLEWALSYGNRAQCENDRVFHMGYKKAVLSETERQESYDRWSKRGVNKNSFIICFFGSINRLFNFETVIKAAKCLSEMNHSNIQFVICGDGERLSHYKRLARGIQNVLFPGWVNISDISTLMDWAKIGLAPHAISDKMATIPNKVAEYFSGGLPILSSLHGELEQILLRNDCGLTYEVGDIQSLVNAILYLCNNPQKRQQMGDNGRRLFETNFSADRVYSEMINHLEKVASGHLKNSRS